MFYQVGSDSLGWSPEAALTAPSPTRATSHVLLTADMGITYGDRSLYHWPCPRALATASHLISFATGSSDGLQPKWDLVLHLGDLAYGTGYASKVRGRKVKFFFFFLCQNPLFALVVCCSRSGTVSWR